MSLLANKKHAAGEATLRISIFRMMLLYLEFANIIRLALTLERFLKSLPVVFIEPTELLPNTLYCTLFRMFLQ